MKNRGEWIARTFLSFWEDESTRPALVAVYRTSLSTSCPRSRRRRGPTPGSV
ncbi:hypothetical protein OHB06_08555 [Streptomyces sp. NBC_01604]|uniref:hypothetical protein n=1 Tax=Streptomyces sp. NBC_01604 TaxID=2975894 RepID=UPI0038642F87